MNSPRHFYEPNILSNPRTHFGVWTPDGWKMPRKRWIKTRPADAGRDNIRIALRQ